VPCTCNPYSCRLWEKKLEHRVIKNLILFIEHLMMSENKMGTIRLIKKFKLIFKYQRDIF